MIGPLFGALIPLLVFGLLGAGAVALVRGRREPIPPLTFATAVHAYAAVVLVVCVILVALGGGLVLKAVFSEIGPRDFSYEVPVEPVYYDSGPYPVPASSGSTPEERAKNAARDDIALGATFLAVGSVLGLVHGFGKAAAARRDRGYERVISRLVDVVLLATGTIVGLASIASLLNELLRRYLLTSDTRDPWDMPHPGEPLGLAITFLPLWALFGLRVWRSLMASGPWAQPSAGSPLPSDAPGSPS